MQFVLGPDFPTGATILGRIGITEATAPVAARSACARSPRSSKAARGLQIVVTEVPYQTSVEVIGQKIAELVNDRKIEGIRDVRNESAGDTVRLVVDLKRDAERAGGAEPALQAHADADELRRAHARARRRRAPAAQPRSRR